MRREILNIIHDCLFEGLPMIQKLEPRWYTQAPKIDSRESWMAFRLSFKQQIQLRWVLMSFEAELPNWYILILMADLVKNPYDES